MPAKPKGARLWLRAEKDRPALWFIKDGDKRIGTGLAAHERDKAEQRLAEYIAEKHQPARDREQSPSSIPVADVLSVYMTDRASTVASANELGQRVKALAGYFGTMMLSDINGAYAAPMQRSGDRLRWPAASLRTCAPRSIIIAARACATPSLTLCCRRSLSRVSDG